MEEKKNENRAPWILAGILGLMIVGCCIFFFSGETDVFKGHLGRSVNVRMATMQNYKESQEKESASDQEMIAIDRPKESEMPKEWWLIKPVLKGIIVNISHPYFLILK